MSLKPLRFLSVLCVSAVRATRDTLNIKLNHCPPLNI
jgi:hypothetical protein